MRSISLWIEVSANKTKSKLLEREYHHVVSIAPRTIGHILFDAGFEWKPEHEWRVKLFEAKGTVEVEIKTAKDFIEWKLPGLLRDPAFLGLPVEERRKAAEQFAKGFFAENFPDFKNLSQGDQTIVLEYLKNQK